MLCLKKCLDLVSQEKKRSNSNNFKWSLELDFVFKKKRTLCDLLFSPYVLPVKKQFHFDELCRSQWK